MNELVHYPHSMTGCDTSVRPAGPIDQLRQRKELLEAQLAKTNEALEALEANPEIARVMQLVGKALY